MNECKKISKYIDIYYDREISPPHEKELFAHLEKCKKCRDLFNEIKFLEKDLLSLKELSLPDDFTANLLKRLPDASSSLWREKIKNIFMSPEALRTNLALVTILLILLLFKPFVGPEIKTGSKNKTIENSNNLYSTRFFLKLPMEFNNVKTVSVVGDFNKWNVNSFKLKYKGDGIWEGAFKIKPGKYEYMFVVDGEKWIPDPKAREYKEDGFGGMNSILTL